MVKACSYKYHPYIDDYLDAIETGTIRTGKDIKNMARFVRRKLDDPNVYVDADKIDDMVRVINTYSGITLIPWELFICGMVHAYEKIGDKSVPLFNKFFIMVGRGNGKNGFISALAMYFTTLNHGVKGYNVDIIANSQEQAMTSFNDVYEVLEEDATGALKNQFEYTKERIYNKHTKSSIKYNTSNARTKDGKRSACLIFDEVHEYENFKLINVFTSGFGKRPHSREFYITTDGYVREGVLDIMLKQARDIMAPDSKSRTRMLPMIYKMDSEEDIRDESNWEKANPSLPYFDHLRMVLQDQYDSMDEIPEMRLEFLTKRMNLPAQDAYTAIATEDQILATNRPIPFDNLKGRACIGGVDYASINDFCSVGLLFCDNGQYYWHQHTFICHKALEIKSRKLGAPIEEWEKQGLCTILPENTIRPEYVVEWFRDKANDYDIRVVKGDKYRAMWLEKEFEQAGIPFEAIRSGEYTDTQLSPFVDEMFAERILACGDDPMWRWYARNVFKEIKPNGNIKYGKVEPVKRKTDGFFAFLHSLDGRNDIAKAEPFYIDMSPILF